MPPLDRLLVRRATAADSADNGTSPTPTATTAGSTSQALHLVAIGDSIPNNSPQDCPGCTGFVDRYAKAVETATGRPVEDESLSEHTGLTLPGLLDELDQLQGKLAAADVIVVGIAHNSNDLSSDLPCGKPRDSNEMPDWSVMDRQRAIRTPAQQRQTAVFVAPWNTMICKSAKANGFGCTDLAKAFNGPDGLRPSGDLLADDYTHPSDKGNATIARVLADLGYAPLA
jgi:lysophospholipase L1-like esterase